MKALKHILTRYTLFMWGLLKPLGVWGVFAGAAFDGGAWGFPIDFMVGGFVAENHARWILYVTMASAGSALGSLVVYAIGYAGGEELLRKRVSPARFEKLHAAFEEHPFWSLMFPAMLPPPTPFKAFALAAAVAEMSITHFLLAIFAGRMIRFSALAILVIKFGPDIVRTVPAFFSHHFHWILIAVVIALGAWLLLRFLRKRAMNAAEVR